MIYDTTEVVAQANQELVAQHQYFSVAEKSRHRIIERATTWIHLNYQSPVLITTLFRVCHASERTLERCFKTTYDCSPRQYILAVRLNSAAKRLKEGDPHATTVSQIAMASGFRHMGRFSLQYRNLYGEFPKQTLGFRCSQVLKTP